MVGVIRDDNWRRVRTQITPAFTTGRLKKVMIVGMGNERDLLLAFGGQTAEKHSNLHTYNKFKAKI